MGQRLDTADFHHTNFRIAIFCYLNNSIIMDFRLYLFILQVNKRRPYHSINFVIAHDGFTLYDLVSYNFKVPPPNSVLEIFSFIKT